MHIEKKLIKYNYEHGVYHHHILILNADNKRYLLSPINIYLQRHCSRSLKTSERYSGNLKNFFTFALENYGAEYGAEFWRKVTESDLRYWQRKLVKERDTSQRRSPSDHTIFANAGLVHEFFAWAARNKMPVAVQPESREWKFNFKDESILTYLKGPLSGSTTDHHAINVSTRRSVREFNKKSLTIMSNSNIVDLIKAYNDPVYPAIFMLALATGMREEGLCQMPYIGHGENQHIRPFPDIKREIGNGSQAKIFQFTVREKGKVRTLSVNMEAWKTICESYLPLYFKRKKKLELRHPKLSSNSLFFINKNGNPVTPKMISDMTYVAKSKLKHFPWTFHSTREWYATNFLIKNLKASDIHNTHYDAAVEDALRRQLGHEDIKTTYMHYIRMASLLIATKDGLLDYALGDTLWRDLEPQLLAV